MAARFTASGVSEIAASPDRDDGRGRRPDDPRREFAHPQRHGCGEHSGQHTETCVVSRRRFRPARIPHGGGHALASGAAGRLRMRLSRLLRAYLSRTRRSRPAGTPRAVMPASVRVAAIAMGVLAALLLTYAGLLW